MKRRQIVLLLMMALAASFYWMPKAGAESGFYGNNCTTSGCHAASSSTCDGCHAHGVHSSSSKNNINVAGTLNKTTYAPGETVSVTIDGGYRTGWVRAILYDQNLSELARSTGTATGGKGGGPAFPTTLTATAPTTPGTYTWRISWYGNKYDKSSAFFQTTCSATVTTNCWKPSTNPNHGEEIRSLAAFTVSAPGDTTAPVVTSFTIPAVAYSLTVPIMTLTATDASGVTGYLLTETSGTPSAAAAGWSGTVPASYTFGSAGTKTLYAWAKDAAGNVSNSLSDTVTITLPPAPDTTAPIVTGFSIPATSSSLTVSITTFTASDNAGVTGYLVNESSTKPPATATGWSASKPANYTFASEGAKTLYAWAKDAADNVSNSLSDTVTITLPDTTAPVVTAFSIPATASSLTVSITTLTATDASGVTGYLLTETSGKPSASAAGWSGTVPANFTFTSEGAKTLYAWAKDAAGNVSNSLSATVTITLSAADTTPPVITVFDVPAVIYSLKVPITALEAADNIGVAGYIVKKSPSKPSATDAGWKATPPGSVAFPDAGVKTVYAWAKDAAGNISDVASMTVVANLSAKPGPIPVPTSQEIFSFSAIPFPKEKGNLAKAKPFGIGAMAEGGNLDLQASIGPFAGPVDVYITMYAPEAAGSLEPLAVYYLRPDNSFAALTTAAEPWQENVTDINEHIVDIPAADLLSGPYILVMTVTPAGSQANYYKWSTSFIVP